MSRANPECVAGCGSFSHIMQLRQLGSGERLHHCRHFAKAQTFAELSTAAREERGKRKKKKIANEQEVFQLLWGFALVMSERSLTSPQQGVTLARAVVPLVLPYSLVILLISLIAPPPPVATSPSPQGHCGWVRRYKRLLSCCLFLLLLSVISHL